MIIVYIIGKKLLQSINYRETNKENPQDDR